jgi:hypothetical protein
MVLHGDLDPADDLLAKAGYEGGLFAAPLRKACNPCGDLGGGAGVAQFRGEVGDGFRIVFLDLADGDCVRELRHGFRIRFGTGGARAAVRIRSL